MAYDTTAAQSLISEVYCPASADTPSKLVDEVWDKALRGTKVDGWPPIQVLILVHEDTLLEAVRQRGRIADIYESLEGIIGRADPMAGAGIAKKMHKLKCMVSFCNWRMIQVPICCPDHQ